MKGKKTAYLDVNGMWFALNVERDIPRNDIRESYTHIAFSVDEDGLKEMVDKLNAIGASILSGRERDTRDMTSIYFEDLDGHKFEFHSGTLQDRLDYYKEAKPHMDFYSRRTTMKLTAINMSEEFASEILSWKYDQPYDFYNNEHDAEAVEELLGNNYSVVVDQNRELIGFFCASSAAQVPLGIKVGAYTEDIIDIGLGMAPTLTGKGNGFAFFSFVLESLYKTYGTVPVRLTVATFNQRAIHLYEKFGFVKEMEFTTDSGEFQTMRKGAL